MMRGIYVFCRTGSSNPAPAGFVVLGISIALSKIPQYRRAAQYMDGRI